MWISSTIHIHRAHQPVTVCVCVCVCCVHASELWLCKTWLLFAFSRLQLCVYGLHFSSIHYLVCACAYCTENIVLCAIYNSTNCTCSFWKQQVPKNCMQIHFNTRYNYIYICIDLRVIMFAVLTLYKNQRLDNPIGKQSSILQMTTEYSGPCSCLETGSFRYFAHKYLMPCFEGLEGET